MSSYKGPLFPYVAVAGSLHTLKLLTIYWRGNIDYLLDWGWDGLTATGWAIRRRDHNEVWADESARLPDEDPSAWYQVWEEMVNTLRWKEKYRRLVIAAFAAERCSYEGDEGESGSDEESDVERSESIDDANDLEASQNEEDADEDDWQDARES